VSDEFDAWVAHVRETTVKAMMESAYVASLVPRGETDVKFALELGLSIMLEKPILAIVQPGAHVPAGLAKVADRIVEADLDTEEGRSVVTAALTEFRP
jgi:hypothetical protein